MDALHALFLVTTIAMTIQRLNVFTVVKSMNKCTGLLGWIFGHKWKPFVRIDPRKRTQMWMRECDRCKCEEEYECNHIWEVYYRPLSLEEDGRAIYRQKKCKLCGIDV